MPFLNEVGLWLPSTIWWLGHFLVGCFKIVFYGGEINTFLQIFCGALLPKEVSTEMKDDKLMKIGGWQKIYESSNLCCCVVDFSALRPFSLLHWWTIGWALLALLKPPSPRIAIFELLYCDRPPSLMKINDQIKPKWRWLFRKINCTRLRWILISFYLKF